MRTLDRFITLSLMALLAACAGVQQTSPPDYQAIVSATDRSDADRQTDIRRKPAELLAFTGVRPGMKVLDLGAGAGYSTELLARVVGSTGIVYAQDTQAAVIRLKDRFDNRAKTPAMKNVVRLVREFEDPAGGLAGLDLVSFFFAYHDTAGAGVDRAKMNQKLFAALKPGGILVIADHSARPGDGVSVAKTLHRIEEDAVRREVEAAGFRLVSEAGFLRHPEDPRNEHSSRSKTAVDEFVLKFEKPI